LSKTVLEHTHSLQNFATKLLEPDERATLSQVRPAIKRIDSLATRIADLETHAELAKAQPLSTSDLARALLHRLSRGDVVKQTLADELVVALRNDEPARSVRPNAEPRQQHTPITDESEAASSNVEQSVEQPENDSSPSKKRRRIEQLTGSRQESQAQLSAGQDTETSAAGTESALSSFKSGSLAGMRVSEESEVEADAEDFVIPPELRRTARQSKPAQQHPDMVHWRDANKRVKGMRPSAASPRKSLA
jgi:Mg-chelatase subunit ChlI